jgi:hypothetical protein
MAIYKAIEYASSCRLCDCRRNSGDRGVRVLHDIHTLTVEELFMSDNWHTPNPRQKSNVESSGESVGS